MKDCVFLVACFAVGCLSEIKTAVLEIRLNRLVCLFKKQQESIFKAVVSKETIST